MAMSGAGEELAICQARDSVEMKACELMYSFLKVHEIKDIVRGRVIDIITLINNKYLIKYASLGRKLPNIYLHSNCHNLWRK